MSRTGSYQDFDSFDDWESFEMDDDIYIGAETDLLDDWEDDGAIAEIRETPIKPIALDLDEKNIEPELDGTSAEVFSLIERAKTKKPQNFDGLDGPSEEELSAIENIGIDKYIDAVLNEETPEVKDDVEILRSAQDDEGATQDDVMVVQDDEGEILRFAQDDEGATQDDSIEVAQDDNVDEVESQLVVRPIFEGIGCNLPTLFDEEGEAEYKTTARLAKRLSQTNSSAIFLATDSGEGQTLSVKEHKNLVKQVVKVIPDTMVIADVSAPSTRQSIELATNAVEAGAKGLIVDLTSRTKDPYALCEALHEKNYGTPILIRLVGQAQDLPISPEFLYDLPIHGVIDATGDAGFLMNLASAYTGPIYVGSISTILLVNALNLAGFVNPSVAIADDLVAGALAGNIDAALALANDERDFGGFTPQRIKQALESQELISSTTRD